VQDIEAVGAGGDDLLHGVIVQHLDILVGRHLEEEFVAGSAGGVAGAEFFLSEDGVFDPNFIEDGSEGSGDLLGTLVEAACASNPEEDLGAFSFRCHFGHGGYLHRGIIFRKSRNVNGNFSRLNAFSMPADDNMILIRNYDLWCQLSDEEYKDLKVEHAVIEVPKGEYIYFEAYNHNKIYFVKEGTIKIGYIDDEGREQVKEIIQKGELFGQFSLERNNLHGEFAQAYKHDVSICAFTIDDFEKLLKNRPDLALKYSKQVGAKLRNIENRLLNLLNKDVKTRLIHFLWQLVEQNLGENTAEGFCIPNFLTHEDIASLIGSSRQTVTTMINELEIEGILSYNRQEICFLDVKKLQKKVGAS
jgi:CRP/FNR family transcriptional regulator